MKLSAVLLLFVLGCVGFTTIDEQRQNLSSGFVGCSPREIQISEGAQSTWTATCKGKVFHCTAAPSASCKERIK